MKIAEMNWMQVEEYLKHDDRAVVPLGSTEQHAHLSLSTDSTLAERVAVEAAEPIGVAVFPVMAYGITPYFMAYPGTISLRVNTYMQVIHDILESLMQHGFKRIVFVNGHGGNTPAQSVCGEFMRDHSHVRIKWHDWWNAPQVWAKVKEIDPVASHASWMENFPWTRPPDVIMPSEQKQPIDLTHIRQLNPHEARAYLGDGNYAGVYQRSDEEMLALWQVGVAETRAVIDQGWA
ncbi:MAG TPA: creatininase family protein [Anaerolineae bacterium]|nr:creatininase family protein [Anaerolineae bacterium]